jgi:hypothetical protein
MTPQERYEDLIDEFAGAAEVKGLEGAEGVTPPHGRSALRYRRKIFAMLVRGRLVLKLPEHRVDELVANGHGVRFDANKGTPMKEWFSVDPESALAWPPLAREALDFARSSPDTRKVSGWLAGPPPGQPAAKHVRP